MADAHKCDRCGKYYDDYKKHQVKFYHNRWFDLTFHVIALKCFDDTAIFDICPECLHEFIDWMRLDTNMDKGENNDE